MAVIGKQSPHGAHADEPDMSTTTVRVSKETKRKLDEEAEARGLPLTAVLDILVEEARRRRRIDEISRGYAMMREDRSEWEDELSQRAEWDATLGDGLEEP